MNDLMKADAMGLALSERQMTLAKQLATSALIPKTLQGKPGDILVVLMTGAELGLQPMQSLRGISVINGKGVCDAALLVGLCVRQSEVCEYFRLVNSDDRQATYEAKRRGSDPVKLTFTLEQAKQAGLTGKENWRNYPAAMLRARCSAHLARAVFPDLVQGIYTTEEAQEFTPAGVVVPMPERDVTPGPAPTPQPQAASRTARVAQAVAAKVHVPTIVDVEPGQSEDEAAALQARREAVFVRAKALGWDAEATKAWAGMLGVPVGKWKSWTAEQCATLEASLAKHEPPDVPLPTDAAQGEA